MNYSLKILEIQNFHSTPEPYTQMETSLSNNFLIQAKEKYGWVLEQFNGVEYNPNKEAILQEFYSKNRFVFGFSKILKLKKLENICSILDFIFDYSRNKNTLSHNSMNYLARILLEGGMKILNDFADKRVSDLDISAMIDESRVYLLKVMEETIRKSESLEITEKKDSKSAEVSTPSFTPEVVSRVSDYERIKKETLEKEEPISTPVVQIQEETVEEIVIPPDKIGLISDFYEEAFQNLSSMGKDLIELENSPGSVELVNTLFRSMHTIKGGSRLLKIKKMEALAHSLENLLDLVRNNKLGVNSEIIDVLLEGKSLLTDILEEIASKGPIQTKINPILLQIQAIQEGKKTVVTNHAVIQEEKKENTISSPSSPLKNPKQEALDLDSGSKLKEPVLRLKAKQSESIRVSTDKLDEVINTASELSVTRIHFQDEVASIHRLIRDIRKLLQRIEESDFASLLKRVSLANEQALFELEGFFSEHNYKFDREKMEIIVKRFYNEIKSEASRSELSISEEMTLLLIAATELKNTTLKNVENLELLTTRLQSGVMNFRMVPLNSLFEKFPTLVRDLARQIGKKVKLEIYGGDTELDRTIINQLSDPLLHIIRNSVDHGLEEPQERLKKGKKEQGVIQLRSYYQGSNAIIEIRDDGKGINKEAVLKKALEKGLVSDDEIPNLSNKQIYEFIFAPGFSTAGSVTELSGRGVGMDVVMSSIKELQGFVDINSEPGKGTTILLNIPLTLAVVRVLLFEVSSRFLALPMSNISEILRVSRKQIETISNRLIYELNGEVIHLVHLSKVLDISTAAYLPDEIPLLILADGPRKIGLIVDSLHGRQEIVIKNLGNILKKVPMVMGCAILSDRKLVLVLNPREVMDSCFEENNNIHTIEFQKSIKNVHNILVVDDSVIHRQNVRMILTRAGYNVDEAENGFEALKMVRIKKYTILCVDVVMPLMDGIELTRRLRNLPLYRTIPILLITSKQSREDRERGIKSGANEYFEKPIDSEILLTAINRYIKERELEGGLQ